MAQHHSESLNNARLSKTLGALLGVHTGDSLGAVVEFASHTFIKENYPNGVREITGGGAFGWPPGHATDDTDLTRAVLLAYQDRATALQNGKPASDFDILKVAADYSLDWYEGRWPDREEGQSPVDVGGATETGLRRYSQSRNPRNCGAGYDRAGNGSLMRCIPTALFSATREERIKESRQISAFTHDDMRCTVSCAAYNEIVAALVEGKCVDDAVDLGIAVANQLNCRPVEEAIRTGIDLPIKRLADVGPGKTLPKWSSGFVLQSLSVAIGALMDSRSFEDVLVDVIGLGGDTDTNGAIAGGLLGARDGIEAIPTRWLDVLQFRDEFQSVGTSLVMQLKDEKEI